MKRLFATLFFGLMLSLLVGVPAAHAQESNATAPTIKNEYVRGKVVQILEDTELNIEGFRQPYQKVKVEIVDGADRGQTFVHDFQLPLNHSDREKLHEGEEVVVVKVTSEGEAEFYIAEKYRLPAVLWVFASFFLLTIAFGGWKGFTSILGLGFSLLILAEFMIPRIAAGANPVFISLVTGLAILCVSLYLAHGFQKRTTVALVGTAITLILAAVASILVVKLTKVFGLGSEEAFTLLQGQLRNINFQGLYLAGVIIGCLGVLDDITTAQAATVDEIHRANTALPVAELYKRGLSVGKEHIASLVNTLALAYVGASLPILLIFTKTDFPLWVIFNGEFLVEEIVRTLVGSAALVLAVPITTYLAAMVFGKETNPPPLPKGSHTHSH